MRRAVPEIERFSKNYLKNEVTGCWEWQANKDKNGYGMFWSKTNERAHRWSYRHFKGQIPQGLTLDHLCMVKNCVNPEHLEAVTNLENIQRSKRNRTTCRKGHPRTAANSFLNIRGDLCCKLCKKTAARKYKVKNRSLRILPQPPKEGGE